MKRRRKRRRQREEEGGEERTEGSRKRMRRGKVRAAVNVIALLHTGERLMPIYGKHTGC